MESAIHIGKSLLDTALLPEIQPAIAILRPFQGGVLQIPKNFEAGSVLLGRPFHTCYVMLVATSPGEQPFAGEIEHGPLGDSSRNETRDAHRKHQERECVQAGTLSLVDCIRIAVISTVQTRIR
jgi:hypothetical protein